GARHRGDRLNGPRPRQPPGERARVAVELIPGDRKVLLRHFWRHGRASFRSGLQCGIGEPDQGTGGAADATVGPLVFTAAVTAFKASARPAPNWSSRPFGPRSRAVVMRMVRTCSGESCGFLASIKAVMPATCAAANEVPVAIW